MKSEHFLILLSLKSSENQRWRYPVKVFHFKIFHTKSLFFNRVWVLCRYSQDGDRDIKGWWLVTIKLKTHKWKLTFLESTPNLWLLCVNNKSRTAYETRHRTSIRQESFIIIHRSKLIEHGLWHFLVAWKLVYQLGQFLTHGFQTYLSDAITK